MATSASSVATVAMVAAADAADTKTAVAAVAAAAPTAPPTATATAAGGLASADEWMELRDVPGAGKGWFARRAIPPATILVIERGLFSPPFLPSKPETREAALRDLTRQMCAAGASDGCNELSFAEHKEAGSSGGTVKTTKRGAKLIPSEDDRFTDEEWSEASARIRTNAFQQIIPFAELPFYQSESTKRALEAERKANAERIAKRAAAHAHEFANAVNDPEKRPPAPITYAGDTEHGGQRSELSVLYVVFPRMARFNHSCWPNVSTFVPSSGDAKVIDLSAVTVREVAVGQQLTISYYDECSVRTREWRRDRLLHSHGFACTCERCGPLSAAAPTTAAAAAPTDSAPAAAGATATAVGGKKKKTKGGEAKSPAAADAAKPIAAARAADVALETATPLIKAKELTRLRALCNALESSGAAQRTTTGVTAAIREWVVRWRNDPLTQSLLTHAVGFQAREAIWRLCLTFWHAAVAHNDVDGMVTPELRALIGTVISEELRALQIVCQTYDSRKRIYYDASLAFTRAGSTGTKGAGGGVAWTTSGVVPAAVIKHYTHVVGWWQRVEDRYRAMMNGGTATTTTATGATSAAGSKEPSATTPSAASAATTATGSKGSKPEAAAPTTTTTTAAKKKNKKKK